MKIDTLHQLIRSLDQGQLRGCRRMLEREDLLNDDGHLLLFTALHGMEYYDHSALEEQLKGHRVARNISVEKNRLFQRLMNQLSMLRKARRTRNDPYHWLDAATLLLEQGMVDEAGEFAQKGISLALEYEDLMAEVHLRETLRTIWKAADRGKLQEVITDNEYRLDTATRKLGRYVRYVQINDRMYDYHRRFRVSTSEAQQKGMEELMAREEMLDINLADSLPAQLRYMNIMSLYHEYVGNHEEGFADKLKLLTLFDRNPLRITMDQVMYTNAIGNVIGRLNVLGRISEAAPLLVRLERIKPTNRREAMWHFIELETQYMLFHLNTGQLHAAREREAGIMAGLRQYGTSLPASSRITFLYNLAVAHLFTDNLGKALAYFDRIRQLGILSDRMDLQGMARLLRLLLLWQDDPEGSFNHYLRNSKRFFHEGHKLYDLEQDIYHWLQEPDRTASRANDQRNALCALAKQMLVHLQKKRVGAEEVMLWANATSQGRTLNSVFLERLASQ
jgi:hypothetical protein